MRSLRNYCLASGHRPGEKQMSCWKLTIRIKMSNPSYQIPILHIR